MQKTGCLSLILAFVLALTCLCAVSCSGKNTYKSDVPVSELCTAADALLPNSSDFAAMTEGYMLGMMEIDPTAYADSAVKLRASGANIDEYGIFKVNSASEIDAATDAVKAYLARRVEAWMPEYMPEEFPKMEAASVKVFGEYVVYAILAEDVKADVFDAIEAILAAK